MSEMIERLAKVAQRWQGHPGVPASAYEPLARLMIEAMREPTEVMTTKHGGRITDTEAAFVWRDMIDAALTNGERNG